MLLILLAGLVTPLLIIGGFYVWQGKWIFRPSRDMPRSPASLKLTFEDVNLSGEDSVPLHAWWVPIQAASKAVIVFHGHTGNIMHEISTLHLLHSLGASVMMVEYPGYGKSGGRPSEYGCYRAAEAAWVFVHEQQGFRPEDVIIFGRSLGSAVGAYVAASRPCGGLVFHSGFTSVPDLAALACPYLPVKWFCRTKMNSLERIAHCQCPVLLLHSETDMVNPIAQAQRVYNSAPGPKKFVHYQGPHEGSYWQTTPGVRTALLDLFMGRTDHWERIA